MATKFEMLLQHKRPRVEKENAKLLPQWHRVFDTISWQDQIAAANQNVVLLRRGCSVTLRRSSLAIIRLDGSVVREWSTMARWCDTLTTTTDEIFTGNRESNAIEVFRHDGTLVRILSWKKEKREPPPLEACPTIVASREELFTSDDNHGIYVFALDGTFHRKWGKKGHQPGRFDEPRHLTLTNNFVFVVDLIRENRVQAFQFDGTFICGWNHRFARTLTGLPSGHLVIAQGGDDWTLAVRDSLGDRLPESFEMRTLDYEGLWPCEIAVLSTGHVICLFKNKQTFDACLVSSSCGLPWPPS